MKIIKISEYATQTTCSICNTCSSEIEVTYAEANQSTENKGYGGKEIQINGISVKCEVRMLPCPICKGPVWFGVPNIRTWEKINALPYGFDLQKLLSAKSFEELKTLLPNTDLEKILY